MYKINKRGQSTVEYILLVAAVIAVMIAFTTSSAPTSMKGTINTTLGEAYGQVGVMSGRYVNAEPAANTALTSPPSQINVPIV